MFASVLILFFCVLGWCSAGLPTVPGLSKIEAKIIEMDACGKDAEALPMVQKDVDIVKQGDSYWASGNFDIRKKIDGPVLVDMVIHTCKVLRDKGTCEVHMKYEGNGCQELIQKQGSLYELVHKVGSNITKCPLEPTKVDFQKMEIKVGETEAAAANAVSHIWYVVIKINGVIDGEPQQVMCTDVWATMQPEEQKKTRTFG